MSYEMQPSGTRAVGDPTASPPTQPATSSPSISPFDPEPSPNLDPPTTNGKRNRLRPIPQPQPHRQLLHDVLDRPLRIAEPSSHLAGGQPLGDQRQHITLT